MKGIAMLTTLTTFIVVLIGRSNADPSALRSSSRSSSEKKEYGGAVGGIEEVSIGRTSNTDQSPMPSRQTLLEQQQQPQAPMSDELLRRPTKTREKNALTVAASADALSEKDLLGSEVGDWEPEQDGKEIVLVTKAYEIPIDAIMLGGTNLLGGGTIHDIHDFHERHLGTTSSECAEDETSISIIVKTDKYGYETSWTLRDTSSGKLMVSGPPDGTKYDDRKVYTGQWCVPSPGEYEIVVEDLKGDGLCTTGAAGEYGCGYFKAYQDGKAVELIVQDTSSWSTKTIIINAIEKDDDDRSIQQSSYSSSSAAGYCSKIAKKMLSKSSGTCTLPNGRTGHTVRVTTKVDKYGEETSWKITKQGGGGAAVMEMAAIVPAYGTKTVEDCLPEGTYDFEISDFDGLCCKHGDGYYAVEIDGTELLAGSTFIGSDTHTLKVGYDWTSNMSERDCEWWWAHHTRRQDWHTRCYSEYCNKDYRHLKWSSSLANDARIYANKLLDTCETEGIVHDHMNEGENLAKNKGLGSWGALYDADKIVGRFVDNEEYWGWNANAHLTQAIWYASRYIGCADSVKDMGNGNTCRMQACRYAKAGNCNMNAYSASDGNNWRIPMMEDDTPCGPTCPDGGCYI